MGERGGRTTLRTAMDERATTPKMLSATAELRLLAPPPSTHAAIPPPPAELARGPFLGLKWGNGILILEKISGYEFTHLDTLTCEAGVIDDGTEVPAQEIRLYSYRTPNVGNAVPITVVERDGKTYVDGRWISGGVSGRSHPGSMWP